ncbi:hypothetical protein AGOR_G00098260 [Albula goreensis]|uniref:AAA+ ATPase domain-containing protein n=1 Tax=Albula goreensis TaxID=1534307 RepID=A0A8T3DJW9_9TELE|nr:hypothetical protein AGOR_G00098260 [Albula goreensis]
MAGAVAMASVIEDFETQPSKKQRKDPPPAKTITNYYSPLPKPFSPPKSNILDYFTKTSPAAEKSSTTEQTKENRNKLPDSPSSVETPVKPLKSLRLKRGRRPGRPTRHSASTEDQQAEKHQQVIEISESRSSDDGAVPVAEKQGLGIMGSDTAALLAQISRDDCIVEDRLDKADSVKTGALPKKCPGDNLKKRSPVKQHQEDSLVSSVHPSGQFSPDDKGRKDRPAVKPARKAKTVLQKQGSSEAQEADRLLCETSLEKNPADTFQLNNSTIFISFKDFVQSQNQEEDNACIKTPEKETETPVTPCISEGEPGHSQQVSPRTLTVQAEVHPVSEVSELARSADKKLASIFTRKRGGDGSERKATGCSPPQDKADPPAPAPMRRSNVVLREDELELAIIESSSMPKCSQAERKQFMNAFKQPGPDSGKGKTKKGPGKQGEVGEKVETLQMEQVEKQETTQDKQSQTTTPSTTEKKEQEKPAKVARKGGSKLGKRYKRSTEEETVNPSPAVEEEPMQTEVSKEEGQGMSDSHSATPTKRGPTRRSARARACTLTPSLEEPTPSPKTRSQERPHNGQGGAEDSSVSQATTPRTHRHKHSMYRAEMLSPPDDKGSPIRMRLRRVFPNSEHKSGEASDFEILSPLAVQKSSMSKNRKQAKKLVQKARALQQNKAAAANENFPLRRSSRNLDVQKHYCEDEDSIVCLSDMQKSTSSAAQDQAKGQKQLRSLNDVLGRNAAENKATKSSAALKMAPMFLGKKPQKPSAVISIFDDSSREGSENSQDDEQFRARREFLKSGLPESFKRQIAKTAASRDAYTLACASFQPVVHVLQRPPECPLWGLPWPSSPLLKDLSESCLEPPKTVLPQGALDYIKTQPAQTAHTEKGSGWRQDFPEEIRKGLLEEIRASNPPFPVRKFFTWFLKKCEEHLLQPESTEAGKATKAPSPPALPEPRGKRKRRQDGDGVGKVSKRRRSARGEEETVVVVDDSPAPPPVPAGRGRLSRTQRSRQQQQEVDTVERTPTQNAPIILLEDTPPPVHTEKECVKEDVLWTEKYQPQHSNEVIGNSAAVKKLHSWLKEWKLRTDREERRNQKEKKQEDSSNDSWDCSDFRGEGGAENGEELLCNTLLITGPPGVGKTAAVYACAQELGFKVFEVNASSQRSGRQILSQLKEATQSHQVDIQGVNTHKPSYFNNYSTSSTKPGFSPRKLNSPRKVVSSPRKPPQSPRGQPTKRGSLAPTSLASFFKMGGNKPKGKNQGLQKNHLQNEPGAQKSVKMESVSKVKDPPSKLSADKKEAPTEELNKKTATSLILFEEVDVIFDDDSGFLAAIKTFMTTTKRPVILTSNDPTFSEMFDGDFEEIHFKTPSIVNVGSYLQLLCLAENVRTDVQDLSSLLCWNRCDIRQSLLHLQFWVRSGGGPGPHRPLPALEPAALKGETKPMDAEKSAGKEGPTASSTPCDVTCTESMLGILNIDNTKDFCDMLKCVSSSQPQSPRYRELLVESWGRGVDLLYSNMEHLLPLPVGTLPLPSHKLQGALKPEPPQSEADLQGSALPENMSPLKVSSSMKSKKRLGLKDNDLFQSDSESDDGFISLPKAQKPPVLEVEGTSADGPQPDPAAMKAPPSASRPVRARKAHQSPDEQKSSELVSQCLGSLAEFMDHMSFLDSSLYHQHPQTEGACRPGTFGWTGAEIKNGLLDEPRMEDMGRGGWESLAEIHATVEHMSFQRCQTKVSEGWAKAQGLQGELRERAVSQLTLPVGPHRRGLSFCQTSPCEPVVLERRCEVMKTMLTSKAFGTLGNKPATATDYLPFLRTVCRSEVEGAREAETKVLALPGCHSPWPLKKYSSAPGC